MAQFHNYLEVCVAIGLHANSEYPMTGPSLEQLYDLPLRKTELLIRKLVRADVIPVMGAMSREFMGALWGLLYI